MATPFVITKKYKDQIVPFTGLFDFFISKNWRPNIRESHSCCGSASLHDFGMIRNFQYYQASLERVLPKSLIPSSRIFAKQDIETRYLLYSMYAVNIVVNNFCSNRNHMTAILAAYQLRGFHKALDALGFKQMYGFYNQNSGNLCYLYSWVRTVSHEDLNYVQYYDDVKEFHNPVIPIMVSNKEEFKP